MIEWILTYLADKVATQLADAVWDKLTPTSWLLLERLGINTRLHIKQLELKMREMPFIYKGLQGDVMNDFVDVEMEPIDTETLLLKSNPRIIDPTERLRRNKKIVFLGSGGIGKTTLQRRTIIDIIQGKAIFPEEDEHLIPYYVPLKAVNNTEPFPIINYLLEANPHLKSNRNFASLELRKLTRLAKSNRVFLFLDGYDEIQLPGVNYLEQLEKINYREDSTRTATERAAKSLTHNNYIRSELGMIMSSNTLLSEAYFQTVKFRQRSPQEYRDFYESLAYCRVWLSCRKEFFSQHPININFAEQYERSQLSALEIRGVGDKRNKLAGNIFNKYPRNRDLLDEEKFIREIDQSTETELKIFSFSPLFLTVMCYIYATKVIEHNNYDVAWIIDFNDLIVECVNLLLKDLDEWRARELKGAQAKAFRDRRGQFYDEKKAFLPYFSAQLYYDEKNLFDITYIETTVEKFFSAKSNSPSAEIILKGLFTVQGTPNFARQLIEQGIFVLVDIHGSDELYDFPHRRFREVLAAKYFDEHDFDFIVNNLLKEGLSELLYVFFKLTESKDHVVEAILGKTKADSVNINYYNSLLANCLKAKPISYKPERVFQSHFTDCIRADIHPRLSNEVLDHFKCSDRYTEFLDEEFERAVHNQRIFSASLCFQLLSRHNKSLLKKSCVNLLLSRFTPTEDLTLALVLKYPLLHQWLGEAGGLNDYQKLFIKLSEHIDSILAANNKGLPISESKEEFVYFLTDKIIDSFESRIDKEHTLFLKDHKYIINRSGSFLVRLAVSAAIKNEILEASKLKVETYNPVAASINKLRDSPTTGKLFM